VALISAFPSKNTHFPEALYCPFVSDASPKSAHRYLRRHPSVTAERSHPADAQHYYRDVARALEDAAEILVVGPSTAKLEFIKYVHKHDHALEGRVVGVETVDHPTDGQLVAYARRYFRAADRMR
jgi:hypothetical protein